MTKEQQEIAMNTSPMACNFAKLVLWNYEHNEKFKNAISPINSSTSLALIPTYHEFCEKWFAAIDDESPHSGDTFSG